MTKTTTLRANPLCRRRDSNPHCSDPKSDLSTDWSTPTASVPVATTPGFGERVAVRTQNTKVLQAIVARIAVDVIQRQWQRLALPAVEAASLATRLLQSGGDQPSPQIGAVRVAGVLHQDLVQRSRLEAAPPRDSASPCLPGEVCRVQIETSYVAEDKAMHTAAGLVPEPPLNRRDGRARLHRLTKILVSPGSERPHTTVDDARQVAVVDPESCNVTTQRAVGSTTGSKSQSTANLAQRATGCDRVSQLRVAPPLRSRHDSRISLILSKYHSVREIEFTGFAFLARESAASGGCCSTARRRRPAGLLIAEFDGHCPIVFLTAERRSAIVAEIV
jgi:hypothetical protein